MSKKLLIASTSTVYGGSYLQYLEEELRNFFKDIDEIIFIPYARPSGISHDEYTARASEFFNKLDIKVVGIHTLIDKRGAIEKSSGIFVGGGNTFLLLRDLYEHHLLDSIRRVVLTNKARYFGTSAGSNVAGVSIKTTNDMPIVYTPSFKALNLLNFNINPHFISKAEGDTHMGESRDTRIEEFLTQNDTPVLGLREGSYLVVNGSNIELKGGLPARLFRKDHSPVELKCGSIVM